MERVRGRGGREGERGEGGEGEGGGVLTLYFFIQGSSEEDGHSSHPLLLS